MANILSGKEVSDHLQQTLKSEIAQSKKRCNRTPHLAVILVGSHGPSQTYVKNKKKCCERVGIRFSLFHFESSVSQEQLLHKLDGLNRDEDISGYIVQLPLPDHICQNTVTLSILPEKDVDGFHPTNLGKMLLSIPAPLPATPLGILELLKYYQIETEGKLCVILGRSHIVGTPMSILLSRKSPFGNATVIQAHSRTRDLAALSRKADILIVAIGKPNYVSDDMVKQGAVVIDVGIHRIMDTTKPKGYRLCGDVDFSTVSKKASHLTPVPGGVGAMTVTALLMNTWQAFQNLQKQT